MGRVLRIITCEKGRRNRLATLLQSSFFIQAMSLGQPWNDWIIGVLFVTKQGRNIAEQSKARTGGNLHQQVLSKIGIAGHVQFEWTSLHKLPGHHNATLQSFPGGAILTSNSFRFFLPLIMVQTKSDAYI